MGLSPSLLFHLCFIVLTPGYLSVLPTNPHPSHWLCTNHSVFFLILTPASKPSTYYFFFLQDCPQSQTFPKLAHLSDFSSNTLWGLSRILHQSRMPLSYFLPVHCCHPSAQHWFHAFNQQVSTCYVPNMDPGNKGSGTQDKWCSWSFILSREAGWWTSWGDMQQLKLWVRETEWGEALF